MNFRTTRWVGPALCAAMAVSLFANSAHADGGIMLDRYSAAELPSDGFVLSRPNDLGDNRVALSLHLEYANDPLVIELRPGTTSSEGAAIVQDQVVAHLAFAYGIANRLVLFAGIDVNLVMSGDDITLPGLSTDQTSADGTGLGDAYVGARLRLVGERKDFFGLALQARLGLPLADAADSGERYAGNEGFTFLPELSAELRPGPLLITANLGALIRKSVSLPNEEEKTGLPFGLGVTIPLLEGFDALAELHGATTFSDFFGRESTPLEALFGGKLHNKEGWVLGAAAGPGLNRGLGSPDYRIVLMLGYEEPEPSEAPAPEVTGDRDNDGLMDDVDRCPDRPEDKDEFADEDGCPDPDNDKDGLLDKVDQCMNEPEDTDGFEDEDGCPDPDNDADGILDADDECVNEAEDMDRFEDKNGCPDPDNDKDTVLDAEDKCMNDPGLPADEGCPRVRVEDGQIRILDRVEFATGKDVILERSNSILEAVQAVLQSHEDITLVRIEGHTDDVGKDKKNLELSRRRALSVRKWLSSHGIANDRLEAWGCGELHPVKSNDDDEGRQANRRVEFHILEPVTDAAEVSKDCVKAK